MIRMMPMFFVKDHMTAYAWRCCIDCSGFPVSSQEKGMPGAKKDRAEAGDFVSDIRDFRYNTQRNTAGEHRRNPDGKEGK